MLQYKNDNTAADDLDSVSGADNFGLLICPREIDDRIGLIRCVNQLRRFCLADLYITSPPSSDTGSEGELTARRGT